MKTIKLSNNKGDILIDDEDFNWLNQFHWSADSKSIRYAMKSIENGYKIPMQVMIMEKYFGPSDLTVDHKDHNGLNNQKNNLRYATEFQNSSNRKKKFNSLSKYKGVSFRKKHNTWQAHICKEYNAKAIGSFKNELDAAIAYDIYAKELHGEFACLNFENISDFDKIRIINIIKNPKKRDGISKYRGVCREHEKWKAYITKDKKYYNLGLFKNEIEAALAYNKKAIELLGDKAKLNTIDE